MSALLASLLGLLLAVSPGVGTTVPALPGDDVPPGWHRLGETRLFNGAELYRHVNGGAELYLRFGFERLAVQDYARGPLQVRVEIYRLSGAPAAAALFAELSAGLAPGAGPGAACTIDDYQVQFHRGSCLVSVTGFEPGAETRTALAALAAAIDRELLAPDA